MIHCRSAPFSLTRRQAVAASAAAIALPAVPLSALAHVQAGLAAAASPTVDRTLVRRALDALARHNSRIWSRDVIAIVDFGLASAVPRFHIIDILAGTTTSLRVTHGRGSDPDHTGLLQGFSDVPGSAASSSGAYLTGPEYVGIHGLSRRLAGLDPSNTHAEERAIVIHSAWYADAAVAEQQGKLGRSDGCFAFGEQDIALVLARLRQGRLIYAGRAIDPE